MQSAVRNVILASAAATVVALLASGLRPVGGQAPAAYRAPRLPDGKPDLNGVWQAVNTANWDLQEHVARAGLVVALLVVAIASHGRAGHAWLPLLVLILAIVPFLLNHLGSFGDNSFHSFAFRRSRSLLMGVQQMLQAFRMLLRLLQVFPEACIQLFVFRGLGHFGQRLYELFLSAVKVLQFVYVEIL